MSYAGMDYLLKKACPSRSDQMMLHFRDKTCGGYPGNVNVLRSDGHSVVLPASARIRIKDFFTPARCRLCFDKMNVFADIVVCDPHGIDGVDTRRGESVTVIRTQTGREIFGAALGHKVLTVREIPYADVLCGQRISEKRREWCSYAEAWNRLGRPLPTPYERLFPISDYRPSGCLYANQLRHALAIDQYSSPNALFMAADKDIFVRDMKSLAMLPLRITRRICRKVMTLLA
jgi:coenzyme F420 hydrogenase subunit beta